MLYQDHDQPLELGGDNIYRIKSVEANGKITFSGIARVNTRGGAAALNLYPNPVKGGEISVQLNALPAGQYTIRVIGSNGQTLSQQQLKHNGGSVTETVGIAGLASGLYSVQISGPVQVQQSFLKH